MEIITRKNLTKKDCTLVLQLESECSQHDNCSYDMYLGNDEFDSNGDLFLLAVEKNNLVGFIYFFNADIPEISGLIHPERRRMGIFTQLYNLMCEKTFCREITFSGKDFYPGFMDCAKSFFQGNFHHEYLMTFSGALPLVPSERLDCEIEEENSESTYFYFLDDVEIGSISVFEDEHTINVFSVFLSEEYRGKGYSKEMLALLLDGMVSTKKKIILQVSEQNKPAFNLYVKCGFKITDASLFYSRLV